jgi:uncharacterized protein (TIGR00266 family)
VQHAITHGPSFALLRVDLAAGETVVGEAGAMVARHEELVMAVRLNAGASEGFFARLKALLVALLRRFIGGETFFVNHFSTARGGSVWLAPPLAGQIVHRRLNGELLLLSRGAYLAHTGAVTLKLKFGGLRGLLAKQGAFFLGVSGHGDLWFSSYGGVETVDVNGSYLVDNGHLVGYEGALTFSIRSAGGGLLGLAASGEGLVCEFHGQGRLWIQTRNLESLAGWLGPMLPR